MMHPPREIPRKKIIALMNAEVRFDLPGYTLGKTEKPPVHNAPFHHEGVNYDHLLDIDLLTIRAKAAAENPQDIFSDKYNYPGGTQELKTVTAPLYQNMMLWLGSIAEGSEIPPPSDECVRKVFAEAYNAFNPAHSYGNYARALLKNMAAALDIKNLDTPSLLKPKPEWTRT